MACVFVFFDPTGIVTMAARSALKGDVLAPTTGAPHSHSPFPLSCQITPLSAKKPFKWREYTLKINNVPAHPLEKWFCIAKEEIGPAEPLAFSWEVINGELRNCSALQWERSGKQRRAMSEQLVAENAAGGVQTSHRPQLHSDSFRRMWSLVMATWDGELPEVIQTRSDHRVSTHRKEPPTFGQLIFLVQDDSTAKPFMSFRRATKH